MPTGGAHSDACAKADPGSLCDCDCAGARHAVGRTGGRPSAGAVTDRAARRARADGREPKVADGPPAGRPDGMPPRRKAGDAVVQASQRPHRVSPPLAARIAKVRDSLPKTKTDWDQATTEAPDPARLAKLRPQLAQYEAARTAAVKAAMDYELNTSLDLQRAGMGHTDALAAVAADPEYQRLAAAADRARQLAADAGLAMSAAQRRQAPRRGGMPAPTAELTGHLDAVTDVGAAVLAEARTAWERDSVHAAAQSRIDAREKARTEIRRIQAFEERWRTARAAGAELPRWQGKRVELADIQALEDQARAPGRFRENDADDRRTVRRRQAEILGQMMASVRGFGGVTHSSAAGISAAQAGALGVPSTPDSPTEAARMDWRTRLEAAEQYFPDAWLARSAGAPLRLVSTRRAFMIDVAGGGGVLAMPNIAQDKNRYDGAFRDYTEETTVHELGHRMESTVPGLTHLEFALVRGRATQAGAVEPLQKLGDLLPGSKYRDDETAQPDDWQSPYTGKVYGKEAAGGAFWEAFQVGLQDTFGRGSTQRGDRGEVLQGFVVGALLTLG